MLQALLKGKLSRDQENMEDILTSNVFGLLRYMPPAVLVDFLSRAVFPNGKPLFDSPVHGRPGLTTEMTFWPWWSEKTCIGCEPDVVVDLAIPGEDSYRILIEAKLYSGKSSGAAEDTRPNDQLAREWDNLAAQCRDKPIRPLLIYLTTHYAFPVHDIHESIQEFKAKRGSEPFIAWLSWRELKPLVDRHAESPMLLDLSALLERMRLTYFGGVAPMAPVRIDWRFNSNRFDWDIGGLTVPSWRFV